MAGDFRLRTAKYLHEVADANLLICHEVEQPEPGVIPERLEELLHVELSFPTHGAYIRFDEYKDKAYIHPRE